MKENNEKFLIYELSSINGLSKYINNLTVITLKVYKEIERQAVVNFFADNGVDVEIKEIDKDRLKIIINDGDQSNDWVRELNKDLLNKMRDNERRLIKELIKKERNERHK